MKNFAHTIAFLMLIMQVANAQSSEKILVSTINLNHQNVLVFAPEGQVEIRKWNSEFVQVQATISIDNSNNSVLKSLVQGGRYMLKSKTHENGLMVESPGLKKQVSIGGVTLLENISYVLFVPDNVTVKLANEHLVEALHQP